MLSVASNPNEGRSRILKSHWHFQLSFSEVSSQHMHANGREYDWQVSISVIPGATYVEEV